MEKNDTNKTILIVVIAIIALCGCLMVSCCALTFYTLSRVDRNKVSELLSEGESEPVRISYTGDTAGSPEAVTAEEPIEGLTAEEQKIIHRRDPRDFRRNQNGSGL